MNEIQNTIKQRLKAIEVSEKVVIPIAIESGSRAWGFASPDSDYDCRFIYVRSPKDYLSVFEQRDLIEDPVDAIYDVSGWDLKKVIKHLVKSNVVMYEWLSSDLVYQLNAAVRDLLWQVGIHYFNPVSASWQYLSMAKNKFDAVSTQEFTKIKTYCYVMRPLVALEYMRVHDKIPHMNFRKNLADVVVPKEILTEINNLLLRKSEAGEGELIEKNQLLTDHFKREIKKSEEWVKTLQGQKPLPLYTEASENKINKYQMADDAFREIIKMVWDNE